MGARDYPRLTALRRQAGWVLWAEALIIAAAPACAIIVLYLVLALLDLGSGWLFCLTMFIAAGLLIRGSRHFAAPERAAIDRRIEIASGLKHRPLAALADAPETDDDYGLWNAHLARVAAALATAKAPQLTLHAAARDPFALRGLLTLVLLTSLIIAGDAIPTRLTGALTLPNWPFPGPHVTAWVTPPSFTGAGPHVLLPGEALTTITGSQLTVIIDGPARAAKIHFGSASFTNTDLSETSHRADATITNSGTLTIGPWWHRLGRWNITATPPAAPSIQITEASVAHGNIIKLRWHVSDPYGLNTLTAAFKPAGFPNALTLSFPLPLKSGDGATLIDLTKSPFGGEPVSITITARNVANASTDANAPGTFNLPGLGLQDSTAIALAKIRQSIANAPATAHAAAITLQKLSQRPPSAISPAADIQISALATSIWLADTNVTDVISRLLALELEISAGPDFIPAQRFAASNQALMAALERGLHGNPPDPTALQKLLEAMEQAAAAHVAALQSSAGQPDKPLHLSALEQLAQKIVADEAAGKTAQAAQELKLFQQILNALQNAHAMTPAQMAQSQAAGAAAQAIAQMTQAEAALLNATQAGTAAPSDQSAIQSQLNATRQNLSKNGISIPGLAPANNAMQSAQQALAQANNGQASHAETAAIKNLQEAAAALAKAAQQQLNFSVGAEDGASPSSGDNPNGTPDEDSDPNFNPDQANPAAAIQQQIIQQDAKPAPPQTHQYYQKLLEPGQ
ncbi:MAG: hypothetical protein B7Z75_01950 [Acidocella sp. 20-57-95]|nr:MAG: hypothetical protein B7Z75_01950 [Acidocella sp. 20-57-95]OYV62201.1 MAG: hypothetical protein B7Z71_02035 [Acidocella sp. 21-58-7]HQT63765.1 DUF4175 family protein [Acidocella sp.]HQU03142.1 DUF4175 family protein [Acidocella sp.]